MIKSLIKAFRRGIVLIISMFANGGLLRCERWPFRL